MKRLIAVLLGILALGTSAARPAVAAVGHPAVVVVGVPGLQWNQVTAAATPALWRLAHIGAAGALSIRSAADVTCAADGWLTLGAGNRVRSGEPCGTTTGVTGDAVPEFGRISRDNHGLDFAAVPGILASSITGCVGAVGQDAALAAADRSGRVGAYADTISAAALARCPVTMVSAPVAADAAGAAAADTLVAAVDAARPRDSVLLVVGLSDLDPNGRAHLHVAIAAGGPFGPGTLRSQSTRRAPYVQLIDVTATVLDLQGVGHVAPVDGQPWRRVGSRPADVAALADADVAAGAGRSVLPYGVLLLVCLVTAGVALALTARRRVAALVLLVALAAPVATYLVDLVPWWRAPSPLATVLLGTLVLASVIAAPAFRLGERRSWIIAGGAVAGLTFAVLVLDVVTGSHLQLNTVLGYSPLVAGRFTGFGNVAYGMLAASAMLLATSLAIKAPGWRGVVAVAAVAVVADGAPMWGSDVGGVLALVPAFAIMVLLCRGASLSWQRLLVIGTGAVAVVLCFALADYARPASRQTHLGRFIGQLLHGGAGTVVSRKLHSDVTLLTANVGTLVVPVIVAVVLVLILRPRPRLARAYGRHPELRHGLVSLAVLALVGLVVNDSGLAIPAVAVLLGVPYVLTVLGGDTPPQPPAEDQRVLP